MDSTYIKRRTVGADMAYVASCVAAAAGVSGASLVNILYDIPMNGTPVEAAAISGILVTAFTFMTIALIEMESMDD